MDFPEYRSPTGHPDTRLDPQEWTPFSSLLERAAREGVDRLSTVRQCPVRQPMPEAVRRRLSHAAPWELAREEAP